MQSRAGRFPVELGESNMCIVCEINADLSKSKATAEEASALLAKVEKLAHALGSVIDVAEAIHERTPDAIKPEELEAVAKAEELFVTENPLGGLGALLAAAILGGVKVETVRVEMQDGESIDEAIARTLKDKEASSQAFTKSTKLH
jgi:hypothetical protein